MEYGHTVVNWIFEHIIDPITNSINGAVDWIKHHIPSSNHQSSVGGNNITNNTTNVSTTANQSTHIINHNNT
jgi:hypothetical protein